MSLDHTDTEVQLNEQGACGGRDHVDDFDIARREHEKKMRHLEMCETELEGHERQITDREQYMAAVDAEMHARGDGIRMGQRPDRVRARCNSGDH